jgi:choice-of-anchor B domain-containing protein
MQKRFSVINGFFRPILLACFILSMFQAAAQIPASKNLSLVGSLAYTQNLSDIWGYVDGSGTEYALVGVYNGVSVVSLADPSNPVEVSFISGPNSTWRDLKTWGTYVYVTNETSGGLRIINLANLPSPINPVTDVYNWGGGSWSGGTNTFTRAHNIWIDENGVAYIAGSNSTGATGAIMANLNSNPTSPTIVGIYGTYCHDLYARGDTLWTAEIYGGVFSAVDVTTKSSPSIMGQGPSFNLFTHNIWPSDNTQTVFTTDEQAGAYVQSHDVSDLGNIAPLDKIRSSLSNGTAIPHNTHVFNDFLITSYYRDGVNIVDAARPHNLVETGYYDTRPEQSGSGFNGCWGAYPFLPSGIILASDIENGLFVLQPTYTRGCYLEGLVTDLQTGNPLFNATVEITSAGITEQTTSTGTYAFGLADSGTYTVSYSQSGYFSQTFNLNLQNGVLTTQDVQLVQLGTTNYDLTVKDVETGLPLANARIGIPLPGGILLDTTDVNGQAKDLELAPGNYIIYAAKWGYETDTIMVSVFDTAHQWVIEITAGYYDDFFFNFPWAVSGNASTGVWVADEPLETVYNAQLINPGTDIATDFGARAFVTGNGGGGPGDDDVDNGNTILTSPKMDLSGYFDPILSFYRWFANDGGSTPLDDTLYIRIFNGTQTATLAKVAGPGQNQWIAEEFYLSDFVPLTATMQVIFEASDLPATGHLVEAAIDVLKVVENEFTCGKDLFEPNNSMLAAANLYNGALAGSKEMRICPRNDEDYFYFVHTKAGKPLQFVLKNLPADYEMEVLYGGIPIAMSGNAGTSDEVIQLATAAAGTYVVRVFGANGAWDPVNGYSLYVNTSMIASGGGVGVKPILTNPIFRTDSPAEGGMAIYPNPATDHVRIELQGMDSEEVQVNLFDLNGRLLWSTQWPVDSRSPGFDLDLSPFPGGTYLLEAVSGAQRFSRKLILMPD